MNAEDLKDLEEMLERQINRRDKEIRVNGFASKKTVNQISRTRLLIAMASER